MRNRFRLLATAAGIALPGLAIPFPARAQVVPDRVDPALVTRSLPPAATDDSGARERVAPRTATAPSPARIGMAASEIAARTISVRGNMVLPADDFAAATRPFIGRTLSQDDLRALAGAVAGVARAQGLVFATAAIDPQPLTDGDLVVTLNEGRIDAVRSIGTSSAAADRILATLVTHRAVTKRALERALLLVGDLPGIRIKDTRYMRQDGFGILLVTVADTRLTSFLELDNRGTREIGPLRGVGLVNLRGVLGAGDELGFVTALTPIDPREFAFFSGRYATPVGDGGGAASISAFYGHTRAGGDFRNLALIGNSYGFGVGYSAVLERSRRHSVWIDIDLHALASDQSASGYRFRDDRLTVLSGTLRTVRSVAGGVLNVSVQANAGLPVPGATHEGDPLASRADGDARYVTGDFQADWSHKLAGPLSIALASYAQIASRPLLATAEISLGGPGFGRAYDYSERTGDQGVLGSAEVRIDLTKLFAPTAQRVQLYAFGDGGVVGNLRDGIGGGSLASGGGGLRVGQGHVDGGVEVAVPITADRLETGNRAPRISGQLAFHF